MVRLTLTKEELEKIDEKAKNGNKRITISKCVRTQLKTKEEVEVVAGETKEGILFVRDYIKPLRDNITGRFVKEA